ncbi:MAG: hypothetical protein SFV54_20085 [Bryobacteraceae bacterium]|nr:hypothetical protein [Bryobacteraceae bacterium]
MSRELHAKGGGGSIPPFRWCGDDEALERYALGRVSGEMLDQFDDHLLVCFSCQDKVADLDDQIGHIRQNLQETRQDDAPRWWQSILPAFSLRPAWAAALALLVVGIFIAPRLPLFSPTPVAVTLSVIRGPELGADAPSDSPLRLRVDLRELPEHDRYRLDIVGATGELIRSAEVGRNGGFLTAEWHGGAPGRYWVRLHAPDGQLLREFGLTLR